MANIPSKADGDIFFAANIYKFVDQDQTGGSIATTTETKIGEVIVDANDISEGILVLSTGDITIDTQNASSSGTVKLYTGPNAAFGSNTLRKSLTRSGSAGSGAPSFDLGWSMMNFITAETWTAQVYVQITGIGDNVASGTSVVTCDSLVVLGI